MTHRLLYFSLAFHALAFTPAIYAVEPDIVFADFEGSDYGAWKAEGEAFGKGPAQGTLPSQMPVSGFAGKRLVNSFVGGDRTNGKLTSPKFRIERKYIGFLIGGGGFEGKTCMNLIVDGKPVRTATGPNTDPGGTEALAPSGWDVSEFAGKDAQIEIIDQATGGWGHINVDQIVQTDTKPKLPPKLTNLSRELTVAEQWLSFPVKNGAKMREVTVSSGGKVVRRLEMELADADPEWWAPLDVSEWKGQTLTIAAKRIPEDSRSLEQLRQSADYPGGDKLYSESLRPQFHFSARRGWLNDPNGMAYFNGQYHLFFQHSPFSWNGSLKHWGQAVSRDLVYWQELGDKIDPDDLGSIWSGSGVVDRKNTSGFGKDGKPPLVLMYTAAGPTFTQCLAYSIDGRAVTKYAGNPVLKQVTHGNRDPKIMWHEPTQRWVTVLYVELPGRKHTVHFFTSPNLREWTLASVTEGGTDPDHFLFECPDFFELPMDGDASKKKWVLAAANTEYAIGSFDGTKFTPETTKLPGQRGRGYYAPQTFSDEPKGRRIQIGWLLTATTGMPFNQSMSIPMELRLISTGDGPRLTYTPVKELEDLRGKSHNLGEVTVAEGQANPLSQITGELFELNAEFAPGDASEIAFNVRGVPVVFDAGKQELVVNGQRAPAPLRDGKQRLTIFADRTCLEVFASDGLTYLPMPINLKPEEKSLAVTVRGGTAKFSKLDVHELRSIWKK
jgi:sucrose-6-phosphate hydrolase SacC (GH32 family)